MWHKSRRDSLVSRTVGGLLPGVFVEVVILIYLLAHIHNELTRFTIYKAIYLSYLEISIPKQ